MCSVALTVDVANCLPSSFGSRVLMSILYAEDCALGFVGYVELDEARAVVLSHARALSALLAFSAARSPMVVIDPDPFRNIGTGICSRRNCSWALCRGSSQRMASETRA